MRITRPLIGTAAGAAVLGATLAFGLTMASASTSSTQAARTSSATTSSTPASPGAASPGTASPSPKASTALGPMPGRKCTHMPGSARSSASGTSAAY